MCPMMGFCQSMKYTEPSGATSTPVRLNQGRFECFAPQSGAFLLHLHAVNALKGDDIAVQKISLELFGKMAARQDACAGTRTRWPVPELFEARMLFGVIDVAAER